jgi:hypothetical protein
VGIRRRIPVRSSGRFMFRSGYYPRPGHIPAAKVVKETLFIILVRQNMLTVKLTGTCEMILNLKICMSWGFHGGDYEE